MLTAVGAEAPLLCRRLLLNRRGGLLRRLHRLRERLTHRHACAHADACARHAAGVVRRLAHRFRRLILRVAVHIAQHAHGRALIHRLFDFFRQGDILDDERRQRQAELLNARVDGLERIIADFVVVRRQIERGQLAFRNRVGQAGHQRALELPFDVLHRVFAACAEHLAQENLRISNAEGICAERAQANHAELGVAHHNGVRRPPFAVKELLGVHKVHVGLERAVEPELPRFQRRHHRHIGGGQLIAAGLEHVRQLAFVDENRHLALADGQLRAHHDFLAVHVVLVNDGVVRAVRPLNDINQLSADDVADAVKNAHDLPPCCLIITVCYAISLYARAPSGTAARESMQSAGQCPYTRPHAQCCRGCGRTGCR